MAKGSKLIEFDPYKVLQLEQSCEPGQIDKAYKKQALRWHPDKNPDNPEKAQTMFLRIYEAYEFLKNEQARAEYDEHIASKRRKAEFEAERQTISSEQRKAHLAKLREAEAKASKATKKRKKEQSARDELIDELRQEGQRMMQRVREEEEKRRHCAQQNHDKQRTSMPTGPSSRQLREELDELEKALFGGTVL